MARKKATEAAIETTAEPVQSPEPVQKTTSDSQQLQQSAETTQPNADGKPVYPNPRSWAHDNQAGVELSTYSNKETKRYEMWIKFRDGKPSEEIRQIMKENGFKWHPDVPKGGNFDVAGAWTLPIGYKTSTQDRLTAERTYADVVEKMFQEKGVGQTR
jgi:hypothetical protein